MKKAEIEEMKMMEFLRKENSINIDSIRHEINHIQAQLEESEYVLRHMDDDLDSYNQRNIDKYYEGEKMDKEFSEHYKIMIEHKKEIEEEREILMRRLKHLKHNYLQSKRKL